MNTLWDRWIYASEDERWEMLCNAHEVLGAIADAPSDLAAHEIVRRWREHEQQMTTRELV